MFLNHYQCPRCDHERSDEWSCQADDDCPSCGLRYISPHDSEEIDGRRYLWADLVALRRAQTQSRAAQQPLFELREDCRPAGERAPAERYREPSLFVRLEPSA